MAKKTKYFTYDASILLGKTPKECKRLIGKIVSYKLKGVNPK